MSKSDFLTPTFQNVRSVIFGVNSLCWIEDEREIVRRNENIFLMMAQSVQVNIFPCHQHMSLALNIRSWMTQTMSGSINILRIPLPLFQAVAVIQFLLIISSATKLIFCIFPHHHINHQSPKHRR